MTQRSRAFAVAAGLALALVACTPSREAPRPEAPALFPDLPADLSLTPVSFTALPGWEGDRVLEALPALKRSCGVFSGRPAGQALGPSVVMGTAADWQALCANLARALPFSPTEADELTFRAFLERHLQPYALSRRGEMPEALAREGLGRDQGIITGYYEAELRGSTRREGPYTVPIYGPPTDLVSVAVEQAGSGQSGTQRRIGRTDPASGRIVPYWTRAEIEDGAMGTAAPVLYWVEDPVNAHLLHIQGSGRIILPDGSAVRVGYAQNNGHTFVGIGRVMLDAGLLAPGQSTMPHIRAWLHANPDRAGEIMRQNPRYIFFRRIEGEGPVGAMGVPLTPRRSMAVDTDYIPLGVPVWLDTHDPDGQPLRRLMVAQDVGSAIKGVVRGDFFWGPGEAALAHAGRMRSVGRTYVLLPRTLVPHGAWDQVQAHR